MRANLWRRKLLFKVKIQLANNSSGHGRYERHNTEVGGWMRNGETKIPNIVREHLQTNKKKLKWEGEGSVKSPTLPRYA